MSQFIPSSATDLLRHETHRDCFFFFLIKHRTVRSIQRCSGQDLLHPALLPPLHQKKTRLFRWEAPPRVSSLTRKRNMFSGFWKAVPMYLETRDRRNKTLQKHISPVDRALEEHDFVHLVVVPCTCSMRRGTWLWPFKVTTCQRVSWSTKICWTRDLLGTST